MIDAGLNHGAPTAVADYKKSVKDAIQAARDTQKRDLDDAMKRIENDGAVLLHCIEESLMSEVFVKFPSVNHV